jgi:alpha-galactosidase
MQATTTSIVCPSSRSFTEETRPDNIYVPLQVDDCWQVKSGRDNLTNELIPDPVNFPRGIKGVADDVHELGLKLGIYSSAGTETCAEYPASLY